MTSGAHRHKVGIMAKVTRRKIVLGGAGAVALAAAGAGTFSILRRRRPNIVLLVMDTFRQDRIGPLTPFLVSAAARGTVCTNSVAASSWTFPSVAGLFTSRYPIVTGEEYNEGFANGAGTFVEALRASGYHTIAFVQNPWLKKRNNKDSAPTLCARGHEDYVFDPTEMEPNPLFAQGIGQKEEIAAWPLPSQAVDAGMKAIMRRRDKRRPFFLYLHFMNNHEPYTPAPKDMSLADAAPPISGIPDHMIFKVIRLRAKQRGVKGLAEEDAVLMARGEALYDASIPAPDEAIKRLADQLRAQDLYEDTIFAVTADHGEEFGEHNSCGHGGTLYQEAVCVPLIFWGPGIPTGNRIETLVSGVDVGPTLLSLAGLEAPDDIDGAAIPLRGVGAFGARKITATEHPPGAPCAARKLTGVSISLIEESRKLILTRPPDWAEDGEVSEFYDMTQDPAEMNNVANAPAHQLRMREMRTALSHYASNAMRRGVAAGIELDEETRNQLRSIGYFQ